MVKKSRAQFVPDYDSSDSDDSGVVILEVGNVVPAVPAAVPPVVQKKRVT